MITPFFKFKFFLGKAVISEKNAIPTKNMQTSANLQNEPYIQISAEAGRPFVKRIYVTAQFCKTLDSVKCGNKFAK